MAIRVGAQIQPQQAEYRQMRDAWVEVEEMGADTLFNWDHFYPLYGDPDGKHFECWTLLAAMAEVTERVEFGALVTCNSYRNPNLLADMARTVDHISDGRLILGIGSGWFQSGLRRVRLRVRHRAGPAARPRRRPAGHRGARSPSSTRRRPRRIPILIGGGGEKVTLRIVAEHADIWNGFGDPERRRHKSGVLDEWCARVGRDPAEIERSVLISPDQIENADGYVERGITHLMLGFGGPDYDLAPLRELVAWRDEYRERNPEVLAG